MHSELSNKVSKQKIQIMELVMEKPLSIQSSKRLFFLSFLMFLFCINCFASKASSELKSIQGMYFENNMILVDSNLNELSETDVQELTDPDMESDAGIEQWMYAQFGWKNTESSGEIIESDIEVPVVSQDSLPENGLGALSPHAEI